MKFADSSGGWNPYIAGALVGLLAIASVYVTTVALGKAKYLGASTTFVRAAGHAESVASPDHVEKNEYYNKTRVKFDWQFLLVIGIALGALVSSLTDKSFKFEASPPIWRERFGKKVWVRAIGGILGGIVLIFGARLASGCPSGHGLSGWMQMSMAGYVALIFFFIGGIILANLIYRGK